MQKIMIATIFLLGVSVLGISELCSGYDVLQTLDTVKGYACNPAVDIVPAKGCSGTSNHTCEDSGTICYLPTDCGDDGDYYLGGARVTCVETSCASPDECHNDEYPTICHQYLECSCELDLYVHFCIKNVVWQTTYYHALGGCS